MKKPTNLAFLYSAFSSNNLQWKKSLLQKDPKILKTFIDILFNIAHFNITVPQDIINKLKKHRQVVYKLFQKRTSDKTRATLLGNNLDIIKIILPLLPNLNTIYKA